MKHKLASYLETLGANEGYGEELWRLYRANGQAVPEAWQKIFLSLEEGGSPDASPDASPAAQGARHNGAATPAAVLPAPVLLDGDRIEPLRGGAARLAANMESSLAVPTATSQRNIAVSRLEAYRRQLNQQLAGQNRKLSITHILAWALVRALEEFPALNRAYTVVDGTPGRIERAHVNLGLAVDVERAGGRALLVPVVQHAGELNFSDFAAECARLIRAAQTGKILPQELMGATISLTNPGTIGTRASVPRLMAGQGAILAAGAVAYPAGFEGVPEATLRVLGVGKTFTLTCTYDHRIVQGAESGAFLARVEALLAGADGLYERIFGDLGFAFPAISLPGPVLGAAAAGGAPDPELVRKQAAVFQLVHMFRVRGHLLATVDPLEMRVAAPHPELELDHYGLSAVDLDQRFVCPLAGRAAGDECSLRDILKTLRATYCGPLALEFMHLQRPEERQWLQEQLEPQQGRLGVPDGLRCRILDKLTQAEEFERLLHTRFVGHKRFSLEGAEALIPALDHLLNLATADGAEQVVLGMSHRGRLNVLVTILGLSMSEMFSKFEDLDPDSVEGSGDVKYHIGAEGSHTSPGGQSLAVELIANPSHLEAVDPVVEGSTRARQDRRPDPLRQIIIPVLIHGDAAFAGQGVVAETLNLSQLGGYRTGGTVHLVVNNQIGFTTSPAGARSSLYCTDVARTVQAPIFHVNGDRPEAVIRALELAYAFRRRYSKDVVVDIVCYRRHGHNEGDDPSLTAPVLYRKIDQHPSVRALYEQELTAQGTLSAEQAALTHQAIKDALSQAADAKTSPVPEPEPASESVDVPPPGDSAATAEMLTAVGAGLSTLPESFHLHPKLRTFIDRRRRAVEERGAVDWSLAEALALGSLALEGVPVRMAGQDTGRGTFSQRHAVLYDYEDGSSYIPLAHLSTAQQPVEIYDSLLSEEAALGFEFGYAMSHPTALVLWEAQFGDFANSAQVIIDQFLAASQTKWSRTCALGLLLPHGYEGQGPEHSSARLERFLQLSAENNWRIANCTTAAQYFHLLRSQGRRQPRLPLVVLTPKSLLRNPEVASPLAQLTAGAFLPVLGDAGADPSAVRRVILCSGKVYYDLARARKERGATSTASTASTAIVRVERLYPFPAAEIAVELARYPQSANIGDVRWVQEEPENMGAWTFVAPRLHTLLETLLGGRARLRGITRRASASPATGSLRRHQQEQAALIAQAFED